MWEEERHRMNGRLCVKMCDRGREAWKGLPLRWSQEIEKASVISSIVNRPPIGGLAGPASDEGSSDTSAQKSPLGAN